MLRTHLIERIGSDLGDGIIVNDTNSIIITDRLGRDWRLTEFIPGSFSQVLIPVAKPLEDDIREYIDEPE